MGLLGRILRLRENFSAYDASYVALADQLDALLLTADAALVRAVRTHPRLPVVDASGAA
jgi:predicted nucleic acid-binding protein